MAGRSTHSNTANNTNPPNETADEVARQLNTTLANLLTRLVQALGGNRVNQREATPSCSIKTFRASGAKEIFRTEGAVGLLTWFESIEDVLYITKCPVESQVEFVSSMLQGRALTWWNTLVQTRGRAVAIALSWEDFKKLLMEEYCLDDEGAMSMANRLTTDGIKDGIFKKKENAGNKKRSNDQNRNRGRDDRNKRQRTEGRAFTLGVAEAPQDPNVVTVTNMIVRGCRLELKGYTFIIDLIPFGHGSFDVIIGMDWLSKIRAKIVCFEKIVQIPLSNGDILEVHGECPEGNLK
uniref:Retrotransposon gag domain-containing protein n=1 Tax=Tanacetum cinerariifolium TaxID=118510 RepID=A0A699J8I3_TANCI|nr:hypothetical protein [Tanacetum cinerariifolium]